MGRGEGRRGKFWTQGGTCCVGFLGTVPVVGELCRIFFPQLTFWFGMRCGYHQDRRYCEGSELHLVVGVFRSCGLVVGVSLGVGLMPEEGTRPPFKGRGKS